MGKHNLKRPIWFTIIVLLLLAGGSLVFTSLQPFSTLKPVIDSLARDGLVESFTPRLYQQVRIWLGLLGLVLLIAGGWSLRNPQASQALMRRAWQELVSGWRTFWKDLGTLWQALLQVERQPGYLFSLAVLLALGFYARLILIEQPFRYDEAYTFIAFALRPLQAAISDYHLPNNHILHTILVRAAYLLFGPQPWAVRLPAFLAGVLLVPATYLTAKLLYNRQVGLMSASLVVCSWSLIDYSANARGYTLLLLFWMLGLALGAYVRDNKNLAGWGALAVLAALGFYTIPIMIYPFGILVMWLFCSWLTSDIHPAYGRSFLLYLLGAGLIAAALTLLLYIPVLRVSGFSAITANQYVRSPGWAVFLESLPGRINATWRMWGLGWPANFNLLVFSGAALSLVLHKRVARHRFPLQLASVVALAGILVTQQIVAIPRVWLFLLPLFLIWAAAGWFGLASTITQRRQAKATAWGEGAFYLASIGVAILLTFSALNNRGVARALDPEDQSIPQEVALYLKENLRESDAVVAAVPINYPLKYYFLLFDVPAGFYYQEDLAADYQRLLVVAEPDSNRPLEYVLERQGLIRRVDLAAVETIYHSGPIEIYALPFK